MKQAKYVQLLSDSTSALTTVRFNDMQLSAFVNKCASMCSELNSKLEKINSDLLALKQTPPPLSKQDLEALHELKRSLEKTTKTLKQDIEKPALEYRKAIEKTGKEINEKLLPELSGHGENCGFDLKFIYKNIEQTKPLLETSKQKLDACFREIIKCQSTISAVSELVHSLNLPNELEKTSLNIEKITKDLASLNLQLAIQPNIKEQYSKEFLPLRAALTSLRFQSQALIEEQKSEASVAAKDLKQKLTM